MTISVCMSTYNGENYIEEQLYSILHQSCRPDEVIICDDASSDSTVEIVSKFIRDNQLEEVWKLYKNSENRGYPANFYHAMSFCSGDLVFLSDQDDIWHEKKLEQMSNVLDKHTKAKVLCCKFGLIDANGSDIHSVMAPVHARGTGELRRITIDDVFYKCEWPGMVIAYRNEWYRAQVEKQTAHVSKKIPHDLMICARSAEEHGFFQMDEELAYHRRHESNAGGEEHRFGKLLNKGRKQTEIQNYLDYLNVFLEGQILQTEAGNTALHRKTQVMEERFEALNSGKIGKVLRWAWKNRRDVRFATAVCDILIVKQRNF